MFDHAFSSCLAVLDLARFEAFGLGRVLAVIVTMIHVTGLNAVVSRGDGKFRALRGSAGARSSLPRTSRGQFSS